MTYTAKLRRLERLLRVNYRAYLDELDKPWPGMEDDLAMAITILRKHTAQSGGRLPLLERCNIPDDPSETATVTLPPWWFEIITTFRDGYEPVEAKYRAQKVFNELIGKQMGGELVTHH